MKSDKVIVIMLRVLGSIVVICALIAAYLVNTTITL